MTSAQNIRRCSLALLACVWCTTVQSGCRKHETAPAAPPAPVTRPAPVATRSPAEVQLAHSRTALGRVPLNTADLLDRCPANLDWLDLGPVNKGVTASLSLPAVPYLRDVVGTAADPEGVLLDYLLKTDFRKDVTLKSTYVMKELDYFTHRAEVQAKFEKRIQAITDPAAKQAAYGQYAHILLYMGEFKKVVAFFGPEAGPNGRFFENGLVQFTLAEATFRLGDYAQSVEYAKRAIPLMPGAQLDTSWKLMLSEVALYGWDFYDRYSKDVYHAEHIHEYFPNDDWGALPFEEVTPQTGVAQWGGTGAVSFADLDGDGWDDLFYERKFHPWKVYRNNKGKSWQEVPESVIGNEACNTQVNTVADVDNDGRPDLYRGCCSWDGPGPKILLKNTTQKGGPLTFEKIAAGAITEATGGAMVPGWADYDLDGHVDLALNFSYGRTRLYHNKGDGTFEDVTEKAMVVSTPPAPEGKGPLFDAVGLAWGDYDEDGYPDLFMQGWEWKRLLHNKGDGTFEDVTEKALVDGVHGHRAYQTFFFDANGDGKLDIFAGQYVIGNADRGRLEVLCTCSNLLSQEGYSEREKNAASTIFLNKGDGTFTNEVRNVGFIPLGTMAQTAADWDNDGDMDILMGTGGPFMPQSEPLLFYENNGDGTFTNKTPFLMLSLWGKGHGAAFADVDHDGNLDLFVNNGGAVPGDAWPSMFFHNRGNANHWVNVGFKPGPGTNSLAIGAKVRIQAGKLNLVQELWSGSRFAGTNSLSVHFGLGPNTVIDRMEIDWPNRRHDKTVLEHVPADQAIEVNEVDGKLVTLWTAHPAAGNTPAVGVAGTH